MNNQREHKNIVTQEQKTAKGNRSRSGSGSGSAITSGSGSGSAIVSGSGSFRSGIGIRDRDGDTGAEATV
jgi:hypothetical protein